NSPKEILHIFKKALPFTCTSSIFQQMALGLDILHSILLHEARKLIYHAVSGWSKKVPRLVKRFKNKFKETCQGWTVAINSNFASRHPNHPSWLTYTLVLLQQVGPIPLTQIAHSKTVIDKIKGMLGKF